MENAYAELVRHIIKEQRAFAFCITVLSTDET